MMVISVTKPLRHRQVVNLKKMRGVFDDRTNNGKMSLDSPRIGGRERVINFSLGDE